MEISSDDDDILRVSTRKAKAKAPSQTKAFSGHTQTASVRSSGIVAASAKTRAKRVIAPPTVPKSGVISSATDKTDTVSAAVEEVNVRVTPGPSTSPHASLMSPITKQPSGVSEIGPETQANEKNWYKVLLKKEQEVDNVQAQVAKLAIKISDKKENLRNKEGEASALHKKIARTRVEIDNIDIVDALKKRSELRKTKAAVVARKQTILKKIEAARDSLGEVKLLQREYTSVIEKLSKNKTDGSKKVRKLHEDLTTLDELAAELHQLALKENKKRKVLKVDIQNKMNEHAEEMNQIKRRVERKEGIESEKQKLEAAKKEYEKLNRDRQKLVNETADLQSVTQNRELETQHLRKKLKTLWTEHQVLVKNVETTKNRLWDLEAQDRTRMSKYKTVDQICDEPDEAPEKENNGDRNNVENYKSSSAEAQLGTSIENKPVIVNNVNNNAPLSTAAFANTAGALNASNSASLRVASLKGDNASQFQFYPSERNVSLESAGSNVVGGADLRRSTFGADSKTSSKFSNLVETMQNSKPSGNVVHASASVRRPLTELVLKDENRSSESPELGMKPYKHRDLTEIMEDSSPGLSVPNNTMNSSGILHSPPKRRIPTLAKSTADATKIKPAKGQVAPSTAEGVTSARPKSAAVVRPKSATRLGSTSIAHGADSKEDVTSQGDAGKKTKATTGLKTRRPSLPPSTRPKKTVVAAKPKAKTSKCDLVESNLVLTPMKPGFGLSPVNSETTGNGFTMATGNGVTTTTGNVQVKAASTIGPSSNKRAGWSASTRTMDSLKSQAAAVAVLKKKEADAEKAAELAEMQEKRSKNIEEKSTNIGETHLGVSMTNISNLSGTHLAGTGPCFKDLGASPDDILDAYVRYGLELKL